MRKQNKKRQSCPKTLYRVKNWSEYDKALVQRGSITFWRSADFEKTWMYTGEKQLGSQFDYADQAILIMLTVVVVRIKDRQVDVLVNQFADGVLQGAGYKLFLK